VLTLLETRSTTPLLGREYGNLAMHQLHDGRVVNYRFAGGQMRESDAPDVWGRAGLAFGEVAGAAVPESSDALQRCLRVTPHVLGQGALRPLAFMARGLIACGKLELASECGELLLRAHHEGASEGWAWPEPLLSYENARLPQGLLACGQALARSDMIRAGLEQLRFLLSVCIDQGVVRLVGNDGWYRKGGTRALFDEQPVDAGALAEAAVLAYEMTREPEFLDAARAAVAWYWGANQLRVSLVDSSGAVFDGLTPSGPNLNRGAESTLSLALAERAWRRAGLGEPPRGESVASSPE
jgi:hypothetical protein